MDSPQMVVTDSVYSLITSLLRYLLLLCSFPPIMDSPQMVVTHPRASGKNSIAWIPISPSVHCSSRHQSMKKLSLDIFEASSIQNCNKRTGAFLHHLDVRPACEMWAGLMCAKFRVACFANDGNLQRRSQIKPFRQPTTHFSVLSLEKLLLWAVVSGSLVSIAKKRLH